MDKNNEAEKAALEALELERRVQHTESLIALANEREWARTHPLPDRRRKPRKAYFEGKTEGQYFKGENHENLKEAKS